MKKEHVLFLRNRPAEFNLGDFLCTPLHYLDFNVIEHQTGFFLKGKQYKTILGGGAFNDLGVSQHVAHNNTVAWGVGSSIHGANSLPSNADNLPFLRYGVRDIDATSDPKKVLPCVTCLHPIVQSVAGAETGVFLNYDSKITSRTFFDKSAIEKKYNVNLFTNNLDEWEFMKAFERHGRIITNSFHVAYWSLLSGREVAIIGYSSKFRSLLKLFNLDSSLINHYDVKTQEKLIDTIGMIMDSQTFVTSLNFKENRNEFIGRNMNFAQDCVNIGFLPSVELKPHNYSNIVARKLKYKALQTAVNLFNKVKN